MRNSHAKKNRVFMVSNTNGRRMRNENSSLMLAYKRACTLSEFAAFIRGAKAYECVNELKWCLSVWQCYDNRSSFANNSHRGIVMTKSFGFKETDISDSCQFIVKMKQERILSKLFVRNCNVPEQFEL